MTVLPTVPPSPNAELANDAIARGVSLNDDANVVLASRERNTSPLATGVNILKSYMGSGLLGYVRARDSNLQLQISMDLSHQYLSRSIYQSIHPCVWLAVDCRMPFEREECLRAR